MQIGRAAGRGSDWSSDVCSSDLGGWGGHHLVVEPVELRHRRAIGSEAGGGGDQRIERARCRSEERRGGEVTGVQTCALPIWVAGAGTTWWWNPLSYVTDVRSARKLAAVWTNASKEPDARTDAYFDNSGQEQIGRAHV